jgi:hypothetical protein
MLSHRTEVVSRPSFVGRTSAENGNSSVPSPFVSPATLLPKGSGAIRGLGENFDTYSIIGSEPIPVLLSTSLGGFAFAPYLSCSHKSGSGPFGMGWSLSKCSSHARWLTVRLAMITRKGQMPCCSSARKTIASWSTSGIGFYRDWEWTDRCSIEDMTLVSALSRVPISH